MAQTVLLAEDEATIGTVVAISLQEEYSVLPTCDADEALCVARSHVNIALLLTDVQMCGGSMNGIELAERMLEEKPERRSWSCRVRSTRWRWQRKRAIRFSKSRSP